MKNHVLRPLWLALGLIAAVLIARHFMVPDDFGVHGDSFTYNFYRLGAAASATTRMLKQSPLPNTALSSARTAMVRVWATPKRSNSFRSTGRGSSVSGATNTWLIRPA